MILVDSSVWIDYFRGTITPQTDQLDSLLRSQIILVGDLILAEVLQGFTNDRDFKQARNLLAALQTVDLAGHDIAIKAAINFRKLRTHGITIRKTIDTLIATYCIHHKIALLYNDRDFEPFVKHLGMKSPI